MKPIDCFNDIIARSDAIAAASGKLTNAIISPPSSPAPFDPDVLRADMLRSSLVLALAALDKYLHERVIKGIVKAFSRPSGLSTYQSDFSVPAKLAFAVARKAAQNAKIDPKAVGKERPVRAANLVRNEIAKLLHKRSFQSWKEIGSAFQLIGINNFEQQVKVSLGEALFGPMKDAISKATRIRNLIVHEGHVARHLRGGQVRHGEITAVFVSDSIAAIKTLVAELEKVRSVKVAKKGKKKA